MRAYLNTVPTAAGQAAFDQKIETGTLAEAQQAARDAMARSTEALGPLAAQYKLSKEQVEQMATQLGLMPEQLVTALTLNGADEAAQDLALIELKLKSVGAGTSVVVNAPTDEARAQLEQLGFKVDEVVGKPGKVTVTAPNAEALNQLRADR